MLKKRKSKAVIILIAVVLLLFFHYLNWLRPVERAILYIVEPAQTNIYSVSSTLYKYITNIFQSQNLSVENEVLRQEVIKLRLNQLELRSVQQENEYLRTELNFIENNNLTAIVSKIISKPRQQNEMLIIDKGSRDGLVEGLPVLVESGVLIGKISKVEEDRSFVSLLTHTKSSVAVSVNNSKNSQGIVQGNLGLGLILDLIPLGHDLQAGSLVFTSGLEDKIPEMYLVGEIVSILDRGSDLYQKAEILPPVDYSALKILTIILPH
jgi:rod shape-determining protein MreC